MKFLIIIIALGASSLALSNGFELKTGDVLLQPLNCWSCRLIEQQENSVYSHMGMVITEGQKTFVIEAYGKVQLIPLKEFLKKTHPSKQVIVRRISNLGLKQKKGISQYSKKLVGHPYDRRFLWNNFQGKVEALYCSELVYKVLNKFVELRDLKTKKMLFDINPLLWDRFFQGETPQDEEGISPEDFNKSQDFETIGELF